MASATCSTRTPSADRALRMRSSGQAMSGRSAIVAPEPTGRNPPGLNRRWFTGAASAMPDPSPRRTTGTSTASTTSAGASGAATTTSQPSFFRAASALHAAAPGRCSPEPTRRTQPGTATATRSTAAALRAALLRPMRNLARRATFWNPCTTQRTRTATSPGERTAATLRSTLPASTTTGGLSVGFHGLAERPLTAVRPSAPASISRTPNSSPAAAQTSDAPASAARRSARV